MLRRSADQAARPTSVEERAGSRGCASHLTRASTTGGGACAGEGGGCRGGRAGWPRRRIGWPARTRAPSSGSRVLCPDAACLGLPGAAKREWWPGRACRDCRSERQASLAGGGQWAPWASWASWDVVGRRRCAVGCLAARAILHAGPRTLLRGRCRPTRGSFPGADAGAVSASRRRLLGFNAPARLRAAARRTRPAGCPRTSPPAARWRSGPGSRPLARRASRAGSARSA